MANHRLYLLFVHPLAPKRLWRWLPFGSERETKVMTYFLGPAGTRVSGHVGFSASSVALVLWLNFWILPVAPPPPYGTTLEPAVQPPTKSRSPCREASKSVTWERGRKGRKLWRRHPGLSLCWERPLGTRATGKEASFQVWRQRVCAFLNKGYKAFYEGSTETGTRLNQRKDKFYQTRRRLYQRV